MKLLIVEENDDMRMLYRIGLRRFEVELLEAKTMAEALQQVQEKHPDAVLIGDTLPDGDPFELCRQIRSNPETQDIVVAIAVYYIDGAIRRLSREVGADACWLAPVPPREIPKQMEELRRRRQASSSDGNNGSQEHPS
ncbi:MAG TPA: response regulator [Thermoflexus sp.]|nr:response regulator [Thermoflexus sp.]